MKKILVGIFALILLFTGVGISNLSKISYAEEITKVENVTSVKNNEKGFADNKNLETKDSDKNFPINTNEINSQIIEYENNENFSVCVIGNASTSVKPDKAYVSVEIQTIDSEMKNSKDNNFKLFDNAANALKEAGLSDNNIVFDSFYSYPSYDCSGVRQVNGYYTTTEFTFMVNDLNNLQNLIDTICENSVTSVRNIRYEISEQEKIYSDVMLQALENAKVKAQNLTGKDSLTIKSIREESVYSCSSLYKNYCEGANISDYIGDVNIEARVVVEFE